MVERVKELIEILNQFLLGALPLTAGIHDDLAAMKEAGQELPDYKYHDIAGKLGDVVELDVQLGIKLHEIRYLLGYLTPSKVKAQSEKRATPLEMAVRALSNLPQEEKDKLLKTLEATTLGGVENSQPDEKKGDK